MNQQAIPPTSSLRDLALGGVEDVDAPDFDRNLIVKLVVDLDVRLAENHEQILRVRLLEIDRDVEIGVHSGLPPGGVELPGLGRPFVVAVARDLRAIRCGLSAERTNLPDGRESNRRFLSASTFLRKYRLRILTASLFLPYQSSMS